MIIVQHVCLNESLGPAWATLMWPKVTHIFVLSTGHTSLTFPM